MVKYQRSTRVNVCALNQKTLLKNCNSLKRTMSSIPQGIFAAKKLRENQEKMTVARMVTGDSNHSQKYYSSKLTELSPLKYNSKLMNSIWGLYNRYSPHNIKSTNDEPAVVGDLQQSVANLNKMAAPKEAADGGKSTNKFQSQNVTKLENLWSSIPISQSH